MRMSHVHCRVRDLQTAARWFERVWQIVPVFNNERMVWLPFGELGVILDAAPDDSLVTIGFELHNPVRQKGKVVRKKFTMRQRCAF